MKKSNLLLAILIAISTALAIPVLAQNNVVKGRLLGLPGNNPLAYTLGLGYERYFGKHFSGQLLFGGPKWRQGSTEERIYYVSTGSITKETSDYQKLGWRLGWNIRFVF